MWYVIDQLILGAEEAAIHEIVALNARHREGELILAPLLDVVEIAVKKAG